MLLKAIFEKTDNVRAKGLLQRCQREKQQESCFSMSMFVSACTQSTKRETLMNDRNVAYGKKQL